MYGLSFDPVADVGDTLKVLVNASGVTPGTEYYQVSFREGLPPSPYSVIDFGALGAYASTAQGIQTALQLDQGYLVQYRVRAIDDAELQLFELGGTTRWYTKGYHSRVGVYTKRDDPTFASTEFFILGKQNNLDPQFTVSNPRPSTITHSRFAFYGWRYLVVQVDKPANDTGCIFVPVVGSN